MNNHHKICRILNIQLVTSFRLPMWPHGNNIMVSSVRAFLDNMSLQNTSYEGIRSNYCLSGELDVTSQNEDKKFSFLN